MAMDCIRICVDCGGLSLRSILYERGMMRNTPDMTSKYDVEEVSRLNADPWMMDLLLLNPSYCSWGPHEDYMCKEGQGWDCRKLFDNWKEFGPWELDDYNEVVNFYFEINRESEECEVCRGGNGYHPDAQWISESFYKHSSPFRTKDERSIQSQRIMESFGSKFTPPAVGQYTGNFPSESVFNNYGPEFRKFCEEMRDGDGYWNDKITQDEVDKLVEEGRLMDYTHTCNKVPGEGWKPISGVVITAAEVNADQNTKGKGHKSMGHDAINRGILIEQRCKRLGIPNTCENCDGHGYTYTEPSAHVSLILWMLHPRKGCSVGIEIKRIQESELQAITDWLKQGAARNAERFSNL